MKTSTSKALFVTAALSFFVLGALFFWKQQALNGGAEFVLEEAQVVDSDFLQSEEVPQEILDAVTEIENSEETENNWSPKAQLLLEILESKNDNDPRMDTALKSLTPEEKREMRDLYRHLDWEDRNGRGTAVFLLGRNIENQEDLEFFVEVLSEPPCLSLRDCEFAEAESMSHLDEHDQSQEITLAYPQVVALKSIEREFASVPKSLRDSILEVLLVASENSNPRIKRMAEAILSQRINN